MPLLKFSVVNKTTIFLIAAMFSASAMPMDFNQPERLAYQGDAISQSNPEVMYYKGQRERKNYIESAKSYQKFADKGGVRAHTVFAINITIAKICVKIISKQVSCIEN
ncbi:hypothetical protein [Psychrobacter sp. DAB_AL62B]|uniref:hypothetical protein n=1 Tax=Psychrobacter sp. DAB_AL62B TaxID=1028420 RepID=UPI00238131F5|nr:hypothetical protein [Psychrobacter sp. DAB_AL62B]MDE4453725.1 hypothetical protein [Psychrobacter sp. DAB_AL62B]